jgi:RimJ/RimL family protein N-acetyltransferase
MKLVPILNSPEENHELLAHPWAGEMVEMTLAFYQKIGFRQPWIGYLAMQDGEVVGTGGFKGAPSAGSVELAYATRDEFRKKGIGTAICKELVGLAIQADPDLEIMACTLPEHNFSTRILEKNHFEFAGTIIDPEDGEVWKWVYRG